LYKEGQKDMKKAIGSNQYRVRHRDVPFTCREKIALTLTLFSIGAYFLYDRPPASLSPCPDTGCSLPLVSAKDVDRIIELDRIQTEQEKPTPENIVSYIMKTWTPHGTPQEKAEAVKAINCFYSESGLRAEAYNYNPPYTDRNGVYHEGTEDRGVAQINSIHGMSKDDAHNYKKNIDMAYKIYKRRGFTAWYGKLCK